MAQRAEAKVSFVDRIVGQALTSLTDRGNYWQVCHGLNESRTTKGIGYSPALGKGDQQSSAVYKTS